MSSWLALGFVSRFGRGWVEARVTDGATGGAREPSARLMGNLIRWERWNGGTVERLRSVRIGGPYIGQLDFLGYCSQFMLRPLPLETRRPADHPTIRQHATVHSDRSS